MQALITSGQRRRNATRFTLFIAILLAALAVSFGSSDTRANAQAESTRFIGAWGASPQEPPTDGNFDGSPDTAPQFEDQTIRNIVNTHFGGDKVRIRLSNEFGDRPITFSSVFIGHEDPAGEPNTDTADAVDDATLRPGSNKQLTFGGKRFITIPAGQEVYSDPVALQVKAFEDLAISFFLPNLTGPATEHFNAQQVNFVAPGNQASRISGAGFQASGESWFFLTDVDVEVGNEDAASIIALGDSLTDGFFFTTPNANNRYPDILAERLQKSERFDHLTVENQGISGNRVLFDGIGPSILKRLDRDALNQPGVTDVILQAGINDLASASFIANPDGSEDIGAQELINGMRKVIERTQARGIKIHCGTITPSGYLENVSPATDENEEPSNPAQGEFVEYSTPEVNRDKDIVNEFIRTSGECDSVIDFDKAIHDPANPDDLRDDLQSPDNLHPNDRGYRVMAEAINLSIFGKDTTPPTVTATAPRDRATGIALNTNVNSFFSEAMKATTINANTVKLFRKQGTTFTRIPAVVSYDAANKRAILNPNANLVPGATYTASVTSGAQDLAGNGLDQNPNQAGKQNKFFTFTTRQ